MTNLLIVVDMQNDFVDGALGTKEAVAIVDKVAKKIQAHKGDIIVTYDTHSEDYMETREGANLPVPHCIEGTEGFELNEKIQNALQGRVYKKVKKPTFGSVELPEHIKEIFDTENLSIQLVGLCTDICVVSNALLLKAHFPEMEISVDASCCAGVTPESHDAAITTMKMCQITIENE